MVSKSTLIAALAALVAIMYFDIARGCLTITATIFTSIALVIVHLTEDKRPELKAENIRGKNVIVTGASSGLGEEMAYIYAGMGANVFITSEKDETLKEVFEKMKKKGSGSAKYGYVIADLTNLKEPERVIEEAVKVLGGIDHLILNHSFLKECENGFWQSNPRNLERLNLMMDCNFEASVHLATHALPHLKKSKGNLAYMSSVAGRTPLPTGLGYSASKSASETFFWGLRQELALQPEYDVSITICTLGYITTDAADRSLKGFAKSMGLTFEEFKRRFPPSDIHEGCLEIIRSVAARANRLMYPGNQYVAARVMIAAILPRLVELNIKPRDR